MYVQNASHHLLQYKEELLLDRKSGCVLCLHTIQLPVHCPNILISVNLRVKVQPAVLSMTWVEIFYSCMIKVNAQVDYL